MDEVNDRLRQARLQAGFKSARSAALRFGWNVSTYAAHENGQNKVAPALSFVYATTFGVDPTWLTFGKSSSDDCLDGSIAVIGEVGINGIVEIYNDFEESPRIAISKISFPMFSVAFKISGTSMWPRYVGDELLVCEKASMRTMDLGIGEEAVIQLTNDILMVRVVLRSADKHSLELRAHNLPSDHVANIQDVWRLWMVVPPTRWSPLTKTANSWNASAAAARTTFRANWLHFA